MAVHWAEGGPTTLSNLAMLCRRHHRAVHEEGYRIDREPDGALQFRRPDGRLLPEVPPPVAVPADPVTILRAQHEEQGLRLPARTTLPGWLGERLDVGWAIDVLHPLATGEAASWRSPEEKSSAPAVSGHPEWVAAADRTVDAPATTMIAPFDPPSSRSV